MGKILDKITKVRLKGRASKKSKLRHLFSISKTIRHVGIIRTIERKFKVKMHLRILIFWSEK